VRLTQRLSSESDCKSALLRQVVGWDTRGILTSDSLAKIVNANARGGSKGNMPGSEDGVDASPAARPQQRKVHHPAATQPATQDSNADESAATDAAVAAAEVHCPTVDANQLRQDVASLLRPLLKAVLQASCHLGPAGGTSRNIADMIVEKKLMPGWQAKDQVVRVKKFVTELESQKLFVHLGSRLWTWSGFPGVKAVPKPPLTGRAAVLRADSQFPEGLKE